MNISLLWFDNSHEPLAAKVRRAAQRYRAHFGQFQNTCYVHPAALDSGTPSVPGIKIKPSSQIGQYQLRLDWEKSE